jgi:hypothetical protein
VRLANGEINWRSWKSPIQVGWRESIVRKAAAHKWTMGDFAEIGVALEFFRKQGFGNFTAWRYVNRQRDLERWALSDQNPARRPR